MGHFDKSEEYSPYIIMELPAHTDDVLEITSLAMQAIDKNFKTGLKYKKVGIILLEIIPKPKFSPDLFTGYSL